jgi:adenylate cyclase, class 2
MLPDLWRRGKHGQRRVRIGRRRRIVRAPIVALLHLSDGIQADYERHRSHQQYQKLKHLSLCRLVLKLFTHFLSSRPPEGSTRLCLSSNDWEREAPGGWHPMNARHLNVEIKARCASPGPVRRLLMEAGARFVGQDEQVDTYFAVPKGRLKLRQGEIENALIQYLRPDRSGPKASDVTMVPLNDPDPVRQVLVAALTVLVVVEKRREIFFIDNVKFHLDEVSGLGTFVEIEAIDVDGRIGEARLRDQCSGYLEFLGIAAADLVEASYSDLLLALRD